MASDAPLLRPPPGVAPADVQGTPLARGIMRDPTFAASVFAHLTYADATPLRAACRGFRGAVAEHPWALPLPLDDTLWFTTDAATTNVVRTSAGLARWRAAFPAARSLLLSDSRHADARGGRLADADMAYVCRSGVAGVQLEGVSGVTPAGLAALTASPALTTLCLSGMPQLSCAHVAEATAVAAAAGLRSLALRRAGGRLTDAHLGGWGGLLSLALETPLCASFTGAGLAALAQLRHLWLGLPRDVTGWPGDVFAALPRLESLSLILGFTPAGEQHKAVLLRGSVGLFAGVPRSLRKVLLSGLTLAWTRREVPDGGAALLAPLAGVADVHLDALQGVTDAGLAALVGATRLTLSDCNGVAGEALAPLAASLRELHVDFGSAFTGAGLGGLASLTRLHVQSAPRFTVAAFRSLAAGCPSLASVTVRQLNLGVLLGLLGDLVPATGVDLAAAQAVLEAAEGGGGGGSGRGWTFHRTEMDWVATRQLPAA
jgi:hypothetical protein